MDCKVRINAMKINIRPFIENDASHLADILKLNGQYDYPEIECPDAMKRVAECSAAVFLVAEVYNHPVGFVKATYDGSRAFIHLISIHPGFQKKGTGTLLLNHVSDELRKRGASGTLVSVTEESAAFWEKHGFKRLPVFLMLKEFEKEKG